MKGLSFLILLSLILVTLIASTGCSPSALPESLQSINPEVVKTNVTPSLLGQDLALLKDTNGKIVNSRSLESDLAEVYKIRYLSDGLEVVGFILKPKGSEGKYPVLIYNRGGHSDLGLIDEAALEYLASYVYRGFVVIASQYRGSDGGEGRLDLGGDDVNDVLNLIPLVESLPFTLPDKIVMRGDSFGGMMTYIVLSKNNKIKAAVVQSAIADCIQMYNEREQEMKKVMIDCIGGDPIQKDAEYRRRSVIYWPEKINTPILILHGDADWRVNVSQSKNLADKLKVLNKTYELVIYPKGDHELSQYPDKNFKILDWFAKYLPDVRFKIPWLGVTGKDIDSTFASTLKLPVDTGIYVISVMASSPAEKAGIKQSNRNNQGQLTGGGDIILGIDNVSLMKMKDLQNYLYSKKVGDVVTLSIYRGNQKFSVLVQLGEFATASN